MLHFNIEHISRQTWHYLQHCTGYLTNIQTEQVTSIPGQLDLWPDLNDSVTVIGDFLFHCHKQCLKSLGIQGWCTVWTSTFGASHYTYNCNWRWTVAPLAFQNLEEKQQRGKEGVSRNARGKSCSSKWFKFAQERWGRATDRGANAPYSPSFGSATEGKPSATRHSSLRKFAFFHCHSSSILLVTTILYTQYTKHFLNIQ